MNREDLLNWIASNFGVEAEYPWDDQNAVLRHGSNRKWFAVILMVSGEKLGLNDVSIVDVVNVKADPRIIGSLLSQPGYHRAYHMNKEKWLSIRLDGTVAAEGIKTMVSMSYDLTGVNPKRKR